MRTSGTLGIVLSAAIIALLTLSATAYKTQKGYVKTRGRQPVNGKYEKGKYIPNATIEVSFGNAKQSTFSQGNGSFSFTLYGNRFNFTKIKAKNFVIYDPDIFTKSYTFSSTPIDIVVASPSSTRLDDYKQNKKRMEENSDNQSKKKNKQLEKLRKEKKISDEQYFELKKKYDEVDRKMGKFIIDLADEYSRIDFDQIGTEQREFIACIQNGDYEKADSLLKTQKSPEELKKDLEELDKNLNIVDQTIAKLQATKEKGEESRNILLNQIKISCKNRYTLCMSKLDVDNAAYWLGYLADSDTTNIDWQLDAGDILQQYIADFDKALHYYNKALALAIESKNLEYEAIALNNIGTAYSRQNENTKALEYHQKALKIRIDIFGEKHQDVATSYNNIGSAYIRQGDYDAALKNYDNSLKILLGLFGEKHPNVATSYGGIGSVYLHQGKYDSSLENYEKALSLLLDFYGEKNAHVATSYSNIGSVYDHQNNFSEALKYHNKALKIRQEVLGENHPDVATSYSKIGSVYKNIGKYPAALKNYEASLKIRTKIFGEDHPSVTTIKENIDQVKELMNGGGDE